MTASTTRYRADQDLAGDKANVDAALNTGKDSRRSDSIKANEVRLKTIVDRLKEGATLSKEERAGIEAEYKAVSRDLKMALMPKLLFDKYNKDALSKDKTLTETT